MTSAALAAPTLTRTVPLSEERRRVAWIVPSRPVVGAKLAPPSVTPEVAPAPGLQTDHRRGGRVQRLAEEDRVGGAEAVVDEQHPYGAVGRAVAHARIALLPAWWTSSSRARGGAAFANRARP